MVTYANFAYPCIFEKYCRQIRTPGSASIDLPRVMAKRRKFSSCRKIFSAEFRRLLDWFGMSAEDVAMKA